MERAETSSPFTFRASLFSDPADVLARVVFGGLFLALAVRIGADFTQTGRITGLLLLASELLVVVLMIVRRTAVSVDRSWRARALTAVSIAGPPLVNPGVAQGPVADVYTATLSACGLLIAIGGKLSLGRSFGLVPANRGIVRSGLYRFIRHPIYLGYMITHAGFLVAYATFWNIVMLLAADTALLRRACYEERTLSQDPEYASYQHAVKWRVLPGVF